MCSILLLITGFLDISYTLHPHSHSLCMQPLVCENTGHYIYCTISTIEVSVELRCSEETTETCIWDIQCTVPLLDPLSQLLVDHLPVLVTKADPHHVHDELIQYLHDWEYMNCSNYRICTSKNSLSVCVLDTLNLHTHYYDRPLHGTSLGLLHYLYLPAWPHDYTLSLHCLPPSLTTWLYPLPALPTSQLDSGDSQNAQGRVWFWNMPRQGWSYSYPVHPSNVVASLDNHHQGNWGDWYINHMSWVFTAYPGMVTLSLLSALLCSLQQL